MTDLPHAPKEVHWARIRQPPAYYESGCSSRNLKGAKGTRRKGLQYEAAALDHLEALFDDRFIPGPWFEYMDDKVRWCQPDGLLVFPERGLIVIIEVKYQHTIRAWFQLNELYLPVVRAAFPGRLWRIALCEVVKWYDPNIEFPQRVKLQRFIDEVLPGQFAVHIWTPDRK